MKIAYFPDQAALNSKPVMDAFIKGCVAAGHLPVPNTYDADAAVIWSVLFMGRMGANRTVYEHFKKQNKPIFVLEVGSLKRGETWKISLNNINRLGAWGNEKDLDFNRPATLALDLQEFRQIRPKTILIATQHERSLQWAGQPPMSTWLQNTIDAVRQYTDIPIVVRPHPRYQFPFKTSQGVSLEVPHKIPNTHDIFDIDYNHHCVINFCSGPSIQSAIAGTPVICDESSLAYPVSMPLESIENPFIPDRTEWFVKLCHTEWTVDEIAKGIPIRRLLEK